MRRNSLAAIPIIILASLTLLVPVRAIRPNAEGPAPSDACTYEQRNGSFESGDFAQWTTPLSEMPWIAVSPRVHEGVYSAALGGASNTTDRFYQAISLPPVASTAELRFWWLLESGKSVGTPGDVLSVEARTDLDGFLVTLFTASSAAVRDQWHQQAIDLRAFPELMGRTWLLSFKGTTDSGPWSTFYVDQITVQVCGAMTLTPSPTAVPSRTPTPSPSPTVTPYLSPTPTTHCPPDAYEPNNALDSARAVTLPLMVSGLTLCPQDEDWFSFGLLAGRHLQADLLFDRAHYAPDAYLYDASGQLVAMSGDSWNGQILSYAVPASGRYALRVFQYPNAEVVPYSLAVQESGTTPTPAPTSTTLAPSPTPSATATGGPTAMASTTPTPGPSPTNTLTPLPTPTATGIPDTPSLVEVRDESGLAQPGAKVYHRGNYVGTTGADGRLRVMNLRVDDGLAALRPVFEKASAKRAGSSAYSIYQTSVAIPIQGAPQLFRVTDPTALQVLIVRHDQALIGMHLVASVEWDAESQYLDEVRVGLGRANQFLYDVTDGQFIFESIELYDDGQHWADADIRFYASGGVWPAADWGGIISGTNAHIYLGRYFGGQTSLRGSWGDPAGYRTIVHQFGHYGLFLWDEYLNRDGKHTPDAHCTTDFLSEPEQTRASIMYNSDMATELCSSGPPGNHHSADTLHDRMTGGQSTWATVLAQYDGRDGDRWRLWSPVQRGAVVAGPDAIPVSGWAGITVHDAQTGACPTLVQVIKDSRGQPVSGAWVWVYPSSPVTATARSLGWTFANGQIEVLGARSGDVLLARKGAEAAQVVASCAAPLVRLQRDPFGVSVRIVPAGLWPLAASRSGVDGQAEPQERWVLMQLQVAATATLPQAPRGTVWQTGSGAQFVAMTYDQSVGAYSGYATLSRDNDLTGSVLIEAEDGLGRVVRVPSAFTITPVSSDEITLVRSEPEN